VAQWIADPVPTMLQAGVPASVTLTFKRNNPVTGSANFVDNLVGLAVGTYATFGLAGPANNVSVRMWGGAGAPIPQLLPTLPSGVANFAAITQGDQSRCVLTADGNVWCWGYEGWGQLGPNAPESGNFTGTMYQVPLPGPAIQISGGDRFFCALVKNGPAYCWGLDTSAQLDGIPGIFQSASPRTYGVAASWVSTGNSHTCTVLSANGTITCYGINSVGQLGNGTTSGTTGQPIAKGAVSVACGGDHSCALLASGDVQCWGMNAFGQLGNGGTSNSSTPVAVALPAPAVEIAANAETTCARLASGTAYCWGENGAGELGSGSVLSVSPTPTPVSGITNATRLFGSEASADFCAQLADQSVRCWGTNSWGQLGDGTITTRFTPVPLQE
jgi:alpha-tubulin suppressor-like RCC1 family protein